MTTNLQDQLAEAIEAADPEPYDAGNWEAVRYYREIAAGLLKSDAIKVIKADALREFAKTLDIYSGTVLNADSAANIARVTANGIEGISRWTNLLLDLAVERDFWYPGYNEPT